MKLFLDIHHKSIIIAQFELYHKWAGWSILTVFIQFFHVARMAPICQLAAKLSVQW